jgi:hypothetical protein
MSDVSQGPVWWQASDGRWYPPQPLPGQWPQPPPPKNKAGRGCLYAILGAVAAVILVGVIIIVIVAIVASKASKSITATNANLGGAAPAAQYTVGQSGSSGGMQFTVYAFKDPRPPAGPFTTIRPGDHLVSLDVQVTNPGSAQRPFSSVLGFHLLDSRNYQYDENSISGLSPPAPDGEIAGGQSVRGLVEFEVPDGTTGLRFRAQGSVTAAGAVWTLS